MIHTFIGLACQDRSRQAPFERISRNPSLFIAEGFMPNGLAFKEPRSMKLDSITKFFEHVAEREVTHGIGKAFRFKAVLSSQKKGVLQPARYHDDDATSAQDRSSVGSTQNDDNRKSKKKSRVTGRLAQPSTPSSSSATGNSAAQHLPAPAQFDTRGTSQLPQSSTPSRSPAIGHSSAQCSPATAQFDTRSTGQLPQSSTPSRSPAIGHSSAQRSPATAQFDTRSTGQLPQSS